VPCGCYYTTVAETDVNRRDAFVARILAHFTPLERFN
jgi:hypothetical protein